MGRSLTSCVRLQALRCLERMARFPPAGLACTPVLSLVAAFFFSAELGTKPRAFHMLGKCSTIELSLIPSQGLLISIFTLGAPK